MKKKRIIDLNFWFNCGHKISAILFLVFFTLNTSTAQCDADGGMISGGPFEFCVDGESDFVSGILLNGNQGSNSQWVITDDLGNILGLPPMPSVVDFDGAGGGVCFIYHLSYNDEISGLMPGENLDNLEGCFSLSNAISVTRNQPEGGVLEGGPFSFCAGDGESDNIPEDAITVTGSSGTNAQWVITDDQGTILGLPPTFSVVDFDGAGAGTCLVWYLSYEDGLEGLVPGNNAATDLEGCYDLSNPIEVVRNGTDADGDGVTVCAGDTADDDPDTYPGAPELCDGIDNDLDGSVDEPENIDSDSEWIENIAIASIDNPSGNDGGYGDYTNLSSDLYIGETQEIELTPGYAAQSKKEKWRVYIDLNQDGIFSHPSERVLQTQGTGSITNTITIPDDALYGETKMRVIMSARGFRKPCDDNYPGEVEDYSIFISENNGNASIQNIAIGQTQSIARQGEALRLKTFPNPSSDVLNIEITGVDEVITLLVIDNLGNLVFKSQNWDKNVYTKLQIADLGMAAGSYSLILKSKSKVISKKLMVVR